MTTTALPLTYPILVSEVARALWRLTPDADESDRNSFPGALRRYGRWALAEMGQPDPNYHSLSYFGGWGSGVIGVVRGTLYYEILGPARWPEPLTTAALGRLAAPLGHEPYDPGMVTVCLLRDLCEIADYTLAQAAGWGDPGRYLPNTKEEWERLEARVRQALAVLTLAAENVLGCRTAGDRE